MRKRSSNPPVIQARNIVITGANGDIAQAIIQRLQGDNLILLSRTLPVPDFPDHIHILINNAGFGQFAYLSELEDSDIDQMFEVNTLNLIKLTKHLQPDQVINIASMAGRLPTVKSSVYSATKAAIIAFSDALRQEGTKVLIVNTGPVRTKFHRKNQGYLDQVSRYVISADLVADQIIRSLGTRRREINLPWQMGLIAKFRALAPSLVDWLGKKFFNYK